MLTPSALSPSRIVGPPWATGEEDVERVPSPTGIVWLLQHLGEAGGAKVGADRVFQQLDDL